MYIKKVLSYNISNMQRTICYIKILIELFMHLKLFIFLIKSLTRQMIIIIIIII